MSDDFKPITSYNVFKHHMLVNIGDKSERVRLWDREERDRLIYINKARQERFKQGATAEQVDCLYLYKYRYFEYFFVNKYK